MADGAITFPFALWWWWWWWWWHTGSVECSSRDAKEESVTTPQQAPQLMASGDEHRHHVGASWRQEPRQLRAPSSKHE
jgi:hypothetical protein